MGDGRFRRAAGLGFDEVYARYGAEVHAYLARLTGDGWTADEICQETFLRYLAHERELVGSNGSLGAWLYRVATNLSIDRLRRRARSPLRTAGTANTADRECAPPSADVEAVIRREVERLEPALRATFLLRAHHGLSFRHVAEALGISERAAKARFRKTRDRLARRLAHLVMEDD